MKRKDFGELWYSAKNWVYYLVPIYFSAEFFPLWKTNTHHHLTLEWRNWYWKYSRDKSNDINAISEFLIRLRILNNVIQFVCIKIKAVCSLREKWIEYDWDYSHEKISVWFNHCNRETYSNLETIENWYWRLLRVNI